MHLIAFCLFLFVLSCFVGICPSKIQENKEKKLKKNKIWAQNARSLARPVPDHALHTHKNQKLGTARACSGTAVPDP